MPTEVQGKSMQRTFLGWDAPILHSAAQYLQSRYLRGGDWDMDRVLVVLPSSLAGRRLGELLAEVAHQQGFVLRPPEIVTVGTLPEKLYQARFPFASDAVQVLCWSKVLRETAPEDLQPLLFDVPTQEQIKPWVDLGSMLSGLHRELATDLMLFEDVADRLKGTLEEGRWRVLARVQRKYLDELHKHGLWDIQTARRRAIDFKEPKTDLEIIVLGAVDMNRAQRRFLDAIQDRVTILVGAPESWSEGFDPYGALQQDYWQDIHVTVDPNILHVRNTVVESAVEVVRQLAALPEGTLAQEVTLGVPDDELIPIMTEQLHRANVVARYGPGVPVNRMPPIQILGAVCEYLDDADFSTFAALVRMPAVSAMLRRSEVLPIDYLQQIDRFYEATLLRSVNVAKWPEGPFAEEVQKVVQAIDAWLHPLRSPAQSLSDWSQPLLAVMQGLYSQTLLNLDQAVDSGLWDACSQVIDGISRLADIPETMQIQVTVTEAIAWVKRHLDKERVPPPQDTNSVELLGWLELALDDAKALILTGLHDGTVPESVNADAFLPNELRRELGLMDNARRYARDCYSLQTILHVREQLAIIVNQHSVQGDPLTPSRLLLAVPSDQLGKRVQYLVSPASPQGLKPIARRWQPKEDQSNIPIPFPAPKKIPTALAVTDFRTYVECPYRFYLRRIEYLQSMDDASTELPPNNFGTLLHDCLSGLFGSPVQSSTDPDAIYDWLHARFDQLVEKQYGVGLRAAVLLQMEQAKLRLRAFSYAQAEHTQQGWSIHAAEFPFSKEDPVRIQVGEKAFYVHGRVDRIDFHAASRTWAVWDYKTSDGAKNPAKVHYHKDRGWIDFQLPLYSEMIRTIKEFESADQVKVGYIQLPKSASQTKFEFAVFEQGSHPEAMKQALQVYESIQQGLFWPREMENVPPWDDYFAICQNDVARPWVRIEPTPSETPGTVGSTSESEVVAGFEQEDAHEHATLDEAGQKGEDSGDRLSKKASGQGVVAKVVSNRVANKRETDLIPTRIRILPVKAGGDVPKAWFDPELIRASAGTGKTYSLAVRMIRLLFADQPLDHVLATTFTRKAAGEILRRVLTKLASAIVEPESLGELRRDLEPLEISRVHCEYQLARLCSQLHRFRVSTLDSFYSQLAKSFSLELQLPPGWHLASEFEEILLRDQAIRRLFETHDRARLRTLLNMLFKGESGQGVQSQIREVVNTGYKLYRMTIADAWTQFPLPPSPSEQELRVALAEIESAKFKQVSLAEARDKLLKQFMESDWATLVGSTLVVNCGSDEPKYSRIKLDPDFAESVKIVGQHAAHQELALRKVQTEASYELLQSYHDQLELVKHQARTISFDDISFKLAKWIGTKLTKSNSSQGEESVNFRLDSRIDHLLLDEFQDTSPAQWDIIRPFAETITREGSKRERERSFFCVGDTKQAIYGWRGGVAEIFDSVQSNLAGIHERGLNLSYRSSPCIIDFVNEVFENLKRHPNYGEGTEAIQKWTNIFPKHDTQKKGLAGYVQLVNGQVKAESWNAEGHEDEESEESLMKKAVDDLAKLAHSAPHISIGVLVRRNKDVATMIHLLRMKGIDASQEGGNPLTDSAAVELILSLLQLADHPGDRIVAFHVASSPLAQALEVNPRIEMDRFAEAIRKRVSDIGYGPTVAYYADQLAPECNERDQQRLEQLVQLAYQYESNATDRIRDFVSYIRSERVALPTPSQVRVMTIHQSKGLEFDAVFLPDLDLQISSRAPSFVAMAADRTSNPTGVIRHFNKALRSYVTTDWQAVFEEVSQQQLTEALCVFYVALTRAKRALYLYTTAHRKPTNRWGSVLHSIVVPNEEERSETDRLLYESGDPEWYQSSGIQNLEVEAEEPSEEEAIQVALGVVDPVESTRRRPTSKPSSAGESRLVSLKQVLQPAASVGAIIGTLVHRWFEEVDWLEDFTWNRAAMRELGLATLKPEEMSHIRLDSLLDDMERMLQMKSVQQSLMRSRYKSWVKAGVTDLEVSNERRLLEILDGYLLRGTIDRLVLGKRKGVVIRAEILDYKTDAFSKEDTIEAWQKERAEHHLPQLELYRRVLCKQFHIDESHVELGLLLLSGDCLVSLEKESHLREHRKHNVAGPKSSEERVETRQMTLDF